MGKTITAVKEGIKANRFNTERMLAKYEQNIKSVSDIEMKLTHFKNQISIMEAQKYILDILEKTNNITYTGY